MAMARIETPFHQVFLNRSISVIQEVIYAQQKEHMEEIKKLLRRNFTMMKIKWLCCKADICWRCLWNIYERPTWEGGVLVDKNYDVEFLLEKEPEVLEACVNHFENYNAYPRTKPKIVGINLGHLEGTCYGCLFDNERDELPLLLHDIHEMRLYKNIILQPKHFMLIGIVFKYMFTHKYDINYYSSMELDEDNL